jgi:hypothetical protein
MVNMFNVWNDSDTGKVYRRLIVGGVLAFVPAIVCLVILLLMNVHYVDIPIPLSPMLFSPIITIKVTTYVVILDVNYLGSPIVYPILSEFTLSMIAIEIISASLAFLIFSYADFPLLLKDVRGYETYGEVKKAVKALIHGSRRDKTMFGLHMAALIIFAVVSAISLLMIIDLITILQAEIAVISTLFFTLIVSSVSVRYFKRRITSQN